MIYHSIIPYDIAFASEPPAEHIMPYMITQYRGVTMQVSSGADGKHTVERLISTDPRHFLRADLQVGEALNNVLFGNI